MMTNQFEIDNNRLNTIIEESFGIVLHYLHTIHQPIYKTLNYDENTLEDMAIDSIVQLFKEGDMEIKSSLDNWQPPVTTEEEFLFFLNKIVSNKLEQILVQLLKEADPLYAEILNSINYLIRKNGNAKTKYLGSIYIIESGLKKIRGKIITREAFNSIPASQFSEDRMLLQNLFFYIKTETEFFPAIPLNALVCRFKELKISGYLFNEKPETPAKLYEINELINKGLSTAKEKLNADYTAMYKLSKKDTQKLYKALVDIGEDLKNGGVNPELYGYFKNYRKDISPGDYKLKYNNTLTYLFRVLRNTIAEELQKE